MKNNPGLYPDKGKGFFFVAAFILLLSSCVTQRDVEYLQDKNETSKEFNDANIEDYRLKPNDELFIQISSLDDAAANIFSGSSTEQSYYIASMQPYGASLISYTIDKEGYLHLPVVGSLLIKDKTIAEVTIMLKESLSNILSQPLVSVKLVNRYVSVLGEVLHPGHYVYSQDKLSIFDALGLAGDITDYGDRNEVILTRNENGKNIRINIDLTQSEILSNNFYYLRPNDIVYVKPLRKKFWDLRQFPYTVIISSITTALLMYDIIAAP